MTTEEKLLRLRKLADAMYYAAQNLTTDASRLHKAMDEYHKFIIHECKEEPVSEQNLSNVGRTGKNWKEAVSENLGEAAEDFSKSTLVGSPYIKKNAFKAGANWQKEQFEKNRLKHCTSITNEQAELEQGFIDQHLDKYNRIPTFLDAIEYGMDKIANLMAEKATDAVVHIDAGGYPYIPQIELYDYDKDIPLAKEGDKYKVILIKED